MKEALPSPISLDRCGMEISLSQESFGSRSLEELLHDGCSMTPFEESDLFEPREDAEKPEQNMRGRKPRSDKGKILRRRTTLSHFLSKRGKYAGVTLEEIEEMRLRATAIEDEHERKREVNKISALRSRMLRRFRLLHDDVTIARLKHVLSETLVLQERLISTSMGVTSLLQGMLADPQNTDTMTGRAEESIAKLGEVFEDITERRGLVDEALGCN